jgi:cell division protein FtsL
MPERDSQRNPNRIYVDRAALRQTDGTDNLVRSFGAERTSERLSTEALAATFRYTPRSYDARGTSIEQRAPAVRTAGRRAKRQRSAANTSRLLWLKRWAILGMIVLSASTVVIFVNNVLRVGKLTEEIEHLKKEQDKLLHQNELYRAEIIRLQAPERITKIAHSRLSMVPASSAPTVLRPPR